MSWKIIVFAGLLCVVASPVLAAPTGATNLLGLDTNGNWVWSYSVTPDAALFTNSGPNGTPPNTLGGSIAIEVGATASNRNLVSIAPNATNFTAIANPGTAIAGFPAGPGTAMTGNNAVAFLGSDFFSTATAKEAFRLHTQGPTNTALTTTVALSGAYTGNGRIAQGGQNFDSVTGTSNGTVLQGNAKLEAVIGGASFALLLSNFETVVGPGGKHWQNGDFNGDGHTNGSDFAIMLSKYGQTDPYWSTHSGSITLTPTPGAGAGAAVPEPASIVLLGLGGLFVAGRCVRRSR